MPPLHHFAGMQNTQRRSFFSASRLPVAFRIRCSSERVFSFLKTCKDFLHGTAYSRHDLDTGCTEGLEGLGPAVSRENYFRLVTGHQGGGLYSSPLSGPDVLGILDQFEIQGLGIRDDETSGAAETWIHLRLQIFP